MRVRATAPGFYGNALRRVNDVFDLADVSHLSCRWMAAVAPNTPESRSTAQGAIDATHDDRSPLGATRVVSRPVDPDEDHGVVFDFNPFD